MTERIEFPQSRCLAGVATSEITPPVGTYHRMWGAARHDQSTGIHRPLRQVTLVLAPVDSGDVARAATVFIAVDHCLFGNSEMNDLLDAISSRSGIDRDRVTIFFSHTHGAGLMGYERRELPGGELIPDYLNWLGGELGDAVKTSLNQIGPASIVYGGGRCDLAANRDYRDPSSDSYVCGFNPAGDADDTVVVARIDDDAGQPLATLVNYACHPTTLAWDNTLISPDFIGAMREIIEQVAGAPCLFIQGASGDIGPRDGFVGDVEIADRNGRRLGYAAMSAFESLPEAGVNFEYSGSVISGATIGTWEYTAIDETRQREVEKWEEVTAEIELPYRDDLPQREALQRDRAHWGSIEADAITSGDNSKALDARAMIERMTRRLARVEHLPAGKSFPFPLRLWRIGDAVWMALDGEHYNFLQRELRNRFPRVPLVIGSLANGSSVWYLPDQESFGKGLYQEDASILAKGSLEIVIDELATQVERMVSS